LEGATSEVKSSSDQDLPDLEAPLSDVEQVNDYNQTIELDCTEE
jgi:hypothetical protein